MGQLDEAIRAHLDLKRKHGASEEEVHAEEQEALGPVRRETVEPPSAELQDPGEPAAEYEPDPAPAPDKPAFDDPLPSSSGEDPLGLPSQGLHDAAEPLLDPVAEAPAETTDLPEVSVPSEEAEPPEPYEGVEGAEAVEFTEATEALDPEPPQPTRGDTPSQGFDRVEDGAPVEEDEAFVEEGGAPLEEEEDEDVLEETPDFLQETPEHDRLWFEQKPPRDFDFDE